MHSIITNFAEWKKIYEAEAQQPAKAQAISLPSLTDDKVISVISTLSGQGMRMLCETLLAKSATLTHGLSKGKDTLRLMSTSWFIKDPARADELGKIANPVQMAASNLAKSLSSQKFPVNQKLGDLSQSEQEFAKLVTSSGEPGLSDSDRALEHPFLPRTTSSQESNYAPMKSKEYDGLGGSSAGLGDTLQVSLSTDAADSLRGIWQAIVNAVIPAEAPAQYAGDESLKKVFLAYAADMKEALSKAPRIADIFRQIQNNRTEQQIAQDFSKPDPAYQVQKNQVKLAPTPEPPATTPEPTISQK